MTSDTVLTLSAKCPYYLCDCLSISHIECISLQRISRDMFVVERSAKALGLSADSMSIRLNPGPKNSLILLGKFPKHVLPAQTVNFVSFRSGIEWSSTGKQKVKIPSSCMHESCHNHKEEGTDALIPPGHRQLVPFIHVYCFGEKYVCSLFLGSLLIQCKHDIYMPLKLLLSA